MSTFAASVRRHRPDYSILVIIVSLLVLSLVLLYSISPVLGHKLFGDVSEQFFLHNQALHLTVGLAVFVVAVKVPWQMWLRWLPYILGATAIASLLLFVPGLAVEQNGATRWIRLFGFSFQPAELLKLAVVFFMAYHGARFMQDGTEKPLEQRRFALVAMAVLGLSGILVLVVQRDLGTMVVVAAIVMTLYFASGAAWRWIGVIGASGLGATLLMIAAFPHRRARVLAFLNQNNLEASSSSYHLNQSLVALGSGGLDGVGLGKSVQVYGYLPEAASDSIFAIIGESFGFIGSSIVVVLLGIFVWRGLRVATHVVDPRAHLIALGITVWFGMQAFVNIGAMIGLIPLTGIPLPFLSYGGSSLISLLFAAGILFNLSRETQNKIEDGKVGQPLRSRRRRVA